MTDESNKNGQQSSALLLKVDYVKYRKAGPGKSPLGALCICDDRIQWSSEAEKDDQLVVPFAKVKGQRISPPNKAKVQLQLCMLNDDQATFVFMNPAHSQEQLLAERDLVKEMLQQALVRHRQFVNQMAQQSAKGGVSDREREAKQQILQQNAHLLDMYKHLVASKLITPSDFWSFHYKTDDKDGKSVETNAGGGAGGAERVGVSGGFLSSIVHSEGLNGIRLNLTTETIQAIFRTYPAVEQKHLELVPHELSEQEFWTRFFQSHYFHRARTTPADVPSTSRASSTTATAALDDPFADCAKMDEKDMAALIAKAQRTLKRHLDLSYIDEDLGILSEMRSAQISIRGSSVAKRLLVRRCNYHSERVLETMTPEAAAADGASARGRSMAAQNGDATIREKNGCGTAAADDQQGRDDEQQSSEEYQLELESHELAELDIVRTNFCPLAAYNAPKHCATEPTDEQMGRANAALTAALERSGSVLEENNQVAFFDLLTARHLDERDEQIERAEAETAIAVNFMDLSKTEVEQVRVVHACLGELLRHFWHCFPARTHELEQKIVRMNETLTKFEQTQLADAERQFGLIFFHQCRAQLSLVRRRFSAFQNAAAAKRPKK